MKKRRVGGLFAICFALLAINASVARAQECTAESAVARIVSVQGTVTVNQAPARVDALVCRDNMIVVGDFSRATMVLIGSESTITIDQKTQLRVLGQDQRDHSLLDLLRGALYLFSRDSRGLDVYTPFANALIEGTEFLVRVTEDRAMVTVFEGRVVAANDLGQLTVGSGQSVIATQDESPKFIDVVRPENAVAWALYYRPVLDALYGAEAAPSTLQQIVGQLGYRDATAILERLAEVSEAQRDADYFAFRAGLLIAVGQAESAQMDLDQALRMNPDSGDARALLAIIAVTRNEIDAAAQMAQRATTLDPQSAAAWLALSYVQQARFELDDALASVETAIAHDPGNGLALSRLAELWLSKGELKKAQNAAEQAVRLRPNLDRTHIVLGFASLTSIDIARAKASFMTAIELNPRDPLARLGLGLVKIREGDLEGGREEIAIAVGLDPQNSLLRSYLGKAYFEERRNVLADRQFTIAKQLDPMDPTPWLYDAIRKQTQNRPIEALAGLHKSIELNDNRAVYRSRLLLDQDQAFRGTSLARIYDDLSFDQLAINEGARSLALDPGNYSAHRFLAHTYSKLARHNIARDSELLQSQLLQPINVSPVRPRLGDDGLSLVEDHSFGSLGFNEFTPLFTANQTRLFADGLVGNRDTFANNLILSGIQNRVSYSIGQSRFETDGFRKNNDLTQDLYNAFFQANLTAKANVQMELRSVDDRRGDRNYLFDDTLFSPDARSNGETQSGRFGFRYDLAPNSTLIGSYVHRNADSVFDDGSFLRTITDESSDFFELRHLYQSRRFNVTAGVGHIDSDIENIVNFLTLPRPPSRAIRESKHTNAYVYANGNHFTNLLLTLGVSGDDLDQVRVSRDEINPKLGMVWTPSRQLTARAAAFRTLKRSLISSQTLEPTQIAGFNQFFDDSNATIAWRYALGLDWKMDTNGAVAGDDMYIGGEITKRDLDVPIFQKGQVVEHDDEEEFHRIYWYWTPSNALAINAEYQYQSTIQQRTTDYTTHRLPLEARAFAHNGLFAGLRATHIEQKGSFDTPSPQPAVKDKDSFWTVDTIFGYRDPNRDFLVTFEVRNLFDEQFRFQDINPASSTVDRGRTYLAKVQFAF